MHNNSRIFQFRLNILTRRNDSSSPENSSSASQTQLVLGGLLWCERPIRSSEHFFISLSFFTMTGPNLGLWLINSYQIEEATSQEGWHISQLLRLPQHTVFRTSWNSTLLPSFSATARFPTQYVIACCIGKPHQTALGMGRSEFLFTNSVPLRDP